MKQPLGLCDALEAKLREAREARMRLTAAVLAGVGKGARELEELERTTAN